MRPNTIVHFRTGIGNFVLFTPALQAMASMDASGKIDLCTDSVWSDYRKSSICDLWERLPYINRVFAINEIDQSKYTTWFWTYWTTAGSARVLFSSKKNYDPPFWDQNKEHESDYYMRIARDIYGYKGEKPPLKIVPGDRPKMDFPFAKKIIFCNGGFGDIQVFKKWNYFNDLASQIRSFFDDVAIIKVGWGDELKGVECDVDYVGKLTLSETAFVIKQADMMISTDTGNMHIADALGTPLIVLWGGSSLPKNGPIQTKNKVIHLGLPCQPCQQAGDYRTCEDRKCLSDIQVGEVMYHLRQYFNKGDFDGNT